jgi:tetrahydromethanopterin S-methyltransferase subunit G
MKIDVYHHSVEARCEVMRRLDALDNKIDLVLETIMSTLEELTSVLATITTEVDKVSADTDNLIAQLAAIPPGGLTPEQQAAIDSAVASATAIADRLKTIDDKVPDVSA